MEPILFKKKGNREKGVDIALTKEVLVNAFNQNFDVGLLVAGDEDYVGLVHEVKRYGQIIHGTFFEEGLSNELKVEFDQFFNLSTELSSPKFNELKNLLHEESHSNSKK